MLDERKIQKMYEEKLSYLEKLTNEQNALPSRISDLASAEWAIKNNKKITEHKNIAIHQVHMLEDILEIKGSKRYGY